MLPVRDRGGRPVRRRRRGRPPDRATALDVLLVALDAVAIAGAVAVGAALGAGRIDEARWLGRRVALVGLVCGCAFGPSS